MDYPVITDNFELDVWNANFLELYGRQLMANKTVYVATTGSDTTGDGTIGNQYRTITKAISIIPKNLNGYIAYIVIANGTYAETVSINGFFGGKLQLSLNASGSVVLNGNLFVENSSFISLRTLSGTATLTINPSSNECIRVNNFGKLEVSGVSLMLNPTSNVGIGIYTCSRFYSNTTVTVNNATRGISMYDTSSMYIVTLAGNGNGIGIFASSGAIVSYTTKTITATAEKSLSGGAIITNLITMP